MLIPKVKTMKKQSVSTLPTDVYVIVKWMKYESFPMYFNHSKNIWQHRLNYENCLFGDLKSANAVRLEHCKPFECSEYSIMLGKFNYDEGVVESL
jgi:hypothetical protein